MAALLATNVNDALTLFEIPTVHDAVAIIWRTMHCHLAASVTDETHFVRIFGRYPPPS